MVVRCITIVLYRTTTGEKSMELEIETREREEEKERKRERKKNKIKKSQSKKPNIKTIKNTLRRYLHLAVRLEESYKLEDGSLVTTCFSCGAEIPFAQSTAGHFLPAGTYPNTRYWRENIHVQCVACNRFKHGNLIDYTMKMIERWGIDYVESLIKLAKAPTTKHKPDHYIQLAREWKNRANDLIKTVY
jgi:5-methylcytosine-specific restriction endonuclease McrA